MTSEPLSYSKLVRFWLPLSLNWQVMAIEGPFIVTLIGALPDSTFNLAAFGIAFAWAFIIETPVMGLLSASASLSHDRRSFLLIRKFMWWVNGITTLLMLLFLFPPIFHWLIENLLGQDAHMAMQIQHAAPFLILWPACIGFRRFYQGVSIAGGKPRFVAYGTVIRIAVMAATGLSAAAMGAPGAVAGCAALIGGVFAEAVAAWLFARPLIAKVMNVTSLPTHSITNAKAFLSFYIPIFLTIFLGVALHPAITFSLGMLPDSVHSLAALPVMNGIWFFAAASTLGLQEASIALLGQHKQHAIAKLRSFAWGYGAVISVALILFAVTGVGAWWLETVMHIPSELQTLVLIGIQMSFMMPLLRAIQSVQRGVVVWQIKTALSTQAAVIELIALAAGLLYLSTYDTLPGILSVAMVMPFSAALATLFLAVKTHVPAGKSNG